MGDTKFTPGKWEVTKGTHTEETQYSSAGESWINVNGPDGGCIADIGLNSHFYDDDEQEANAALIAAAPELYEALVYLMEGVRGLPPLTAIAGTLIPHFEKAKAAMSRATDNTVK